MKFSLQQYISQKYALLFLIVFFVGSVLYVTFQAQSSWNEHTQNSWEIAFVEPQGENLDFFLANYQGDGMFSYEVFRGGEMVQRETFKSTFGKEEIIILEEKAQGNEGVIYRINVVDELGNERVIYKQK